MYICQNCKSHDIIESEGYAVWFREGDMLRNRMVMVYQNLNSLNRGLGWIAFCEELSKVVCGNGQTQQEAILDLGNILRDMNISDMIGKRVSE